MPSKEKKTYTGSSVASVASPVKRRCATLRLWGSLGPSGSGLAWAAAAAAALPRLSGLSGRIAPSPYPPRPPRLPNPCSPSLPGPLPLCNDISTQKGCSGLCYCDSTYVSIMMASKETVATC